MFAVRLGDVNIADNALDVVGTVGVMSRAPEPRDRQGERLAWREAGEGEVMLLLHGLGGSRISWEPQLRGLADRWRVVAWDLPGYGASPPLSGRVTFDGLAEMVIELLDELEVERGHLVGISFGGMIAQYAAARHGDRFASMSLLATSSRFGLDGTAPDVWRAARLAPLDAGLEPADFAERVLRAIAGPDISTEAFAQQQAAMARISGAALRRSIDCLVTHDSQPLLPQLTTPTQVLVGELDAETPVAYADDLAARIPGAVRHAIAGAGHLLNAEAPEQVNELLAEHVLRARRTTP